MVIQILAFLLMSLPTAAEAVADVREWKKNIRDKKGLDVVLRGGAFILVGFLQSLFTDTTWWQGVILSFGIFVMFFDYIMAVLLKKPFHFLGTTSKIDRFLSQLHWPFVMFFRGILFASALTTYYDLHKVLYGNF